MGSRQTSQFDARIIATSQPLSLASRTRDIDVVSTPFVCVKESSGIAASFCPPVNEFVAPDSGRRNEIVHSHVSQQSVRIRK